MKAQIALLFRDHAHLLEEYWVFYEQLHSTMQCMSHDEDEEEDEVETDSTPSAQILHSVKKAKNKKNQNSIQVIDASLKKTLMKGQTVCFILICSDITISTIMCSFCLRVLM